MSTAPAPSSPVPATAAVEPATTPEAPAFASGVRFPHTTDPAPAASSPGAGSTNPLEHA